jgi:hypothetical protein
MGLDLIPMGKPKPGFEARFVELYRQLSQPGKAKKQGGLTRKQLLAEWYANQVQAYETIRAPRIGRDQAADAWARERYEELEERPPLAEFLAKYDGYYVIELAEELDGVPVYAAVGQDGHVFRGQFIADCEDIIGEELVNEAWETKMAPQALDYGLRLMAAADQLAGQPGLACLKTQRYPPDADEDELESKLHILYSLAKWLIFYGQNGHGYIADF